ncbi:unnamed protein product [Owenia fusiformis]|uniref:Uncharacterized protein n=1 Tax=Owenia fusiformis TaxID=6347 RepID=A0A8J1U8J1_OWEFU|nr:unnamed protein product [Owenia fusiformis]
MSRPILICIVLVVLTAGAFGHDVSIRGRFTCGGAAVKNALVRLLDQDYLVDDILADGWTDENGEFELSGDGVDGWNGNPDVFIKLEYNYLNKMVVKDRTLRVRYETSEITNNFSGKSDIGTINVNNEHCRVYQLFREAILDYTLRSENDNLPYDYLTVHTDALLSLVSGTRKPWSNIDTIRVPGGYPLNATTARHELAHTLRHAMDGGRLHWWADISSYSYVQPHHCNMRSNPGFAFNEGWAIYWSGNCKCSEGSDMNVEGHVAARLCELARCKSDSQMWDILESNPGTIHSYAEFEEKLFSKYQPAC